MQTAHHGVKACVYVGFLKASSDIVHDGPSICSEAVSREVMKRHQEKVSQLLLADELY